MIINQVQPKSLSLFDKRSLVLPLTRRRARRRCRWSGGKNRWFVIELAGNPFFQDIRRNVLFDVRIEKVRVFTEIRLDRIGRDQRIGRFRISWRKRRRKLISSRVKSFSLVFKWFSLRFWPEGTLIISWMRVNSSQAPTNDNEFLSLSLLRFSSAAICCRRRENDVPVCWRSFFFVERSAVERADVQHLIKFMMTKTVIRRKDNDFRHRSSTTLKRNTGRSVFGSRRTNERTIESMRGRETRERTRTVCCAYKSNAISRS